MRALSLYSGGLDSSLAIKVMQEQNLDIIALNFVSYFFGGKNILLEKNASKIDVPLEYIDFKNEHRDMVENPSSGYGKNMNPCIDCHALMIKKAGELLKKFNANFIITGEVLGQRPMSQNSEALKRVEKLSGMNGLVVRPLSGKLLPVTIPEEKKWIKRELLLDLEGRGRKRQIELAENFGLEEYPSPAGGCCLTNPNYSKKLKILKDDDQFDHTFLFCLIKFGRLFRLAAGKYIVVGRNEHENKKLNELKKYGEYFITGDKTFGPDILMIGNNFSQDEINIASKIFSRYSCIKGKEIVSIKINGIATQFDKINLDETKVFINKFLIQ